MTTLDHTRTGVPADATTFSSSTDPRKHSAFANRHLGPREADVADMLKTIGCASLDELVEQTVPQSIRLTRPLELAPPAGEHEALKVLHQLASQNKVLRSMIGMGYYGTLTPAVLLRNLLENPLWYTPYTPYQAEIAQGRLEALLNFQTMVSDLTALPVANASLLDEATAAAEAMAMCFSIARQKRPVFYASSHCHPQTLAVLYTRARSMGIDLQLIDSHEPSDLPDLANACGVLVQCPRTDGKIEQHDALVDAVHEAGALVVVATDLLALTLMTPPGEYGKDGADIAVGSSQRFGVPMGYGGPHAAFMATKEAFARKMPGRIVGVSVDSAGDRAYRLAIQTREQHIKRDKATSNICTAQVLLAVTAGMYATWHGPKGLQRIARQVHAHAASLADALQNIGANVNTNAGCFFDTFTVTCKSETQVDAILKAALEQGINLRKLNADTIGIACDETTNENDLNGALAAFAQVLNASASAVEVDENRLPQFALRSSEYLTHEVFNSYHSEHEMLRYLTRLCGKDVSLAHSMIPLGSCTMKLNAAAEMIPITWKTFSDIHPYAPRDQAKGYAQLIEQLEDWLSEMTGFAAVSLQPNAGSQGEYAGLLAIHHYHQANGQPQRNICLIPTSAHGTNPASAVIAGMKVVAVKCDANGNVDVEDLKAKVEQHSEQLAAIMITYPSTHGVFESKVRQVCELVHEHGGQVYMDGANLNAQLGLTSPGTIGADVCHLNLHKTFCIPHGGGGPGMGPIGVAKHLKPYLPTTDILENIQAGTAVSAAPYGSPMILPISWMYIRMMGVAGLTRATQIAILNANYMAKRLENHYPVLYRGEHGRAAHEFILDCRGFEKSVGIRVDDIAKRLMDFGFHAPTMSFPVPGTLMIEPTESESREELDRFCEAMICIREEIAAIERGEHNADQSPLRHAPHTVAAMTRDDWPHAYTRQQAAYPLEWVRERKLWPAVGRIDNVQGDRNLICTCPSVEDAAE